MEEKTAKQEIAEQRETLEKIKADNDRKKKHFKLHTIIFGVIVIVLLVVSIIAGKTVDETRYKKLMTAYNSNDTEKAASIIKSGSLVGYKDGSSIYEELVLGNSNNCIIKQKGKILTVGDTKYQSIDGGLVRIKGQDKETIYENSVSYLNKLDSETIIFRDDNSDHLIKYDLVGDRVSKEIENFKIGEILVDNGTIYFIDLSNHHLCKFDDSMNKEEILDTEVDTFAILGKSYIVLDSKGVLSIVGKLSKTASNKLENISTFTVANKIYAQSGNTIFSFSPSFDDAEEVCKDRGNLLFVGANGVYTFDNNCIFLINGTEKKAVAKDISICKEIYETGSNQIIIHSVSIEEIKIIDEYKTYDF